MADPFVGEIRLFAGNFEPRGWAFCNGQVLSISQNTALFSLLGTYYGGNGQTTFALPDLRDRVPMHWGPGPGLSDRTIGETGGAASITLISSELPAHNHALRGLADPAESSAPSAKTLARGVNLIAYSSGAANTSMNPNAVSLAGSSQPHNNLPPYLALNFIIALQGVFPPRG